MSVLDKLKLKSEESKQGEVSPAPASPAGGKITGAKAPKSPTAKTKRLSVKKPDSKLKTSAGRAKQPTVSLRACVCVRLPLSEHVFRRSRLDPVEQSDPQVEP
jgi:hypothetical protein